MKKITVIGCGVIGLTSAITLERAGYDVRIITRNLHFKTTSAIAGAFWMPYKADPIDLVNQWSLETYHVFEKESQDIIAGVSMADFLYLCKEGEVPNWEDAMPAGALRKAKKEELPASYSFGYIARVPIIETPIYLEYLFDEFRGEIILDEVLSFEELDDSDTLIINCTGLGAKSLTNDSELYPVRGQIVKTEADPNIIPTADDDPEHFFYIVSRRDCTIIGGTAEIKDYNLIPDESTTQTIMDRASKIFPQVKDLPIQKSEVGLRPYRSSIRLEKDTDQNIIHNYGHGGSGFTVSWGCANAVLDLVRNSFA